MSRILRRPMFRGGGTVNSYGTGITAPLVPGYMGGGQIGGVIIYGKPMADGRFGFQAPVMFNAAELTMPASGSITSGLELLAKNKALRDGNVPMIPVNVAGVKDEKQDQTTDDGKSQVVEDLDFSEMNTDFDQTKKITLDDGSSVMVNVPAEEVKPSAQIQPGAFASQTVGYAPPAAPASPMTNFLTGAAGGAGIMGKLGLFG